MHNVASTFVLVAKIISVSGINHLIYVKFAFILSAWLTVGYLEWFYVPNVNVINFFGFR